MATKKHEEPDVEPVTPEEEEQVAPDTAFEAAFKEAAEPVEETAFKA